MWNLPALAAVAASRGSTPQTAPRAIAASRTVRAIGPAESWECEIGMMPARLHSPTVGLMPTTPLIDDGHMIEPPVSVPMVSAARFAEAAVPDPELDPQGLRSSA